MRVKITVMDGHGQSFEGEVELSPAVRPGGMSPPRSTSRVVADAKIDFGLPRRAFLKQHAQGRSGPQKFAVLIAHMTQGKTGVEVKHDDAEREWRRNRGVLGGEYQYVYATRSKGEGWTDSPRRGIFVLRAGWRAALTSRG